MQYLVLLAALLIPAGLGGRSAWRYAALERRREAAQRWPVATGRIELIPAEPLRGPSGEWFRLHGRFAAGGREYGLRRVSLRGFGARAGRVFLRRLAPGDPVSVYYNPADPSDHTLLPPSAHGTAGALLALAFWGALTVALAMLVLRGVA